MDALYGIGVDLAIREGSAVWVGVDGHRVINFSIITDWSFKRKSEVIKDPQAVWARLRYTLKLNTRWLTNQRCKVAVDWSQEEIFMSGQKTVAMRKAFLTGALFEWLEELGYHPEQCPPNDVRSLLSLKRNCSKAHVVKFFEQVHLSSNLLSRWGMLNEHQKDSIILGYCAAITSHNSK